MSVKISGARVFVLSVVVAALGVAGCGGSSKPSTSSASPPAQTTATVNISSYKFLPATLAVTAGAKVTFVNHDSAPHTATDNNGAFDSGTLKQGQSKILTLSKPGTYAYHCLFHAFMTATVTVK